MKKPYKSSRETIIINSTTNYGGAIDNVLNEDKKGIEKTYIQEAYDYTKEINQRTPENIDRVNEKTNNHSESYKEITYNRNKENDYKNNYKEKIETDRVKSYRNSEYKKSLYRINEENRQATPENLDRWESVLGKHDTEFVSRGKASSFILRKEKAEDLIYYEDRHKDNNTSKLIDRNPSNIVKNIGIKEERRGNFEGRNEEKTIKPDGIIEKNLTTRTLENKYIRSKFAENMGGGDESFSVNLSKTGVISGEKALKLGASLGRYTSVNAINLFRKDKINNMSMKSTLKRSTKDAILNFRGGNSDDIGVRTVVEVKDKTIQAGRILTDRKGFIRTSLTNLQIEGNQDLGIRTAIQAKDVTILSTRVVKGVYGTTKTTAKTAKRTYQIGKKAAHKVTYGFSKIMKSISNPLVLKGIIGILIPLALIFLIVSTVTTIFPTSTAIASYPIAEVEFIEELQDNINSWNEEINTTIQSYYRSYDDVKILNDSMVVVQLQDVLAILAVETQQDIGFKDMSLARDIYQLFYSLETEIESYEEVDRDYNPETGEYTESTTQRTRIIVDLINFDIEEVIENQNYDESNREWAIALSMADLTEMYPDLVVSNESYYPSMPSLTPEEIEKYGGIFVHPTNRVGYISSSFGYRIHPITKKRSFHSGLDIAGNNRSPIYSVQDGEVIFSGPNGTYGNCVIIDHGNDMITLYAHCSTLSVVKGDSVLKGDNIALVGNTGRSTGPHLHFEVRINGKFINPINFLN